MKTFIGKNNSKYLKIVIYSHIIAVIAVALLPATPIIRNRFEVAILNIIFISLVSLFFILTFKIHPKAKYITSGKNLKGKQLRFNITLIFILSIVGFVCLLYDRIVIRGINYSLGLRAARYQWLDSSGGSIISIIGNLIIPFGYVGLFILIFYYQILKKYQVLMLICAIIFSVFGHSALNGGRSNLLIAVILSGIFFLLKKHFQINKKRKPFFLWFPILIGVIVYISYITLSSADMGNISMQMLTKLGIESLYGSVNEDFYALNKMGVAINLIIYCFAYLYHGQWTAEITFSLIDRTGNYTFYSYLSMFKALGIPIGDIEQGYFAKTGAFISLPGAFYYDFGYLGVIILSGVLGILFAVAIIMLNYSKNISGTKLAFIIYVMSVLIMSPILPAYGFVYLNFVIIAFVMIDIINRIVFKVRTNYVYTLEEN